MPTPYKLLTSGTLGEISLGTSLAVSSLLLLMAQLDLQLGATFGLGQLKADLMVQLQASLELSLSITNPAASLLAAVEGMIQALAALQAQIASGITLPQIALTANVDAIASLQLRIQGLQLLLDLALGLQVQVGEVIAALQAALSVGPVALYGATGQPLGALLNQMMSADYAQVGLQGGDLCDALVLISKAPGFRAGASVLFPMPPA
jgi:hypothetical protein